MRTTRSYAWMLSSPVAVILLLCIPAWAQVKETYEPPGYLLEWGSNGSSNGQFDFPRGVAVDASGNVYVGDTGNNRIQKFDGSGNFLRQWGGAGSGDGQFAGPWGLAADASGYVYVCDSSNHRIQKFDGSGNFLTKWGSNGSGNGQFSSPVGVAADAFGNVYVADSANDRIQKFDGSGNFLTKWGSIDGQLFNPGDVAVDALGNVYVADTNHHQLQKFDGNGTFLAKWGSSGGGAGEFYFPRGVAVDDSGNVYVADTGNSFVVVNNRIQKFAPVLWFDVAGYESYLSVETSRETTAVRTLFQLENNGAPRFALKNTSSDVEWSFQQSGPGNFLISKEGTGGPEMQVYQNGQVRMGPGGAANFTLSPIGNLTLKGSLTASGSTFPDYVFEPDYRLMPLRDLESYIDREKHLPDLPSAKEIERQGGHDMTELQLKLLKKIEELTLHTLTQEQQLEAQDREIRQLEVDLEGIRAALNPEGRAN